MAAQGIRSEIKTKTETEMRWEEVRKKLLGYMKIDDAEERAKHITLLLKVAATPSQKLLILLRLVQYIVCFKSLHFHSKSSSDSHCISLTSWKKCVHYMFLALDILQQYPNIIVHKYISKSGDDTKFGADYTGEIKVMADLANLVKHIKAEICYSFEYIEPDSTEYKERLKDEHILFALCQNVLAYLLREGDSKSIANVANLLMEQLYFKPTETYDAMRKYVRENNIQDLEEEDEHNHVNDHQPPFVRIPKLVSRVPAYPENCKTLMDYLFSLVLAHGRKVAVVEAYIYHIHHRAITDDYILNDTQWKEILMDGIYNMENVWKKSKFRCNLIKARYCRTVALVGVCAYRAGRLHQAGYYMAEIFSSEPGGEEDRVVLIGKKGQEVPLEKESWEEMFGLPYYKHIDRDHLEYVYSVCRTTQG